MKATERKELLATLSDAYRKYAKAMDMLNKPCNAYWFRKSSSAFEHGFYIIGRLYSWIARRNMYKQDWHDIILFINHGKI